MTPEIKDDLLYTKTHEWIRVLGKTAQIGITDHAQEELTDIVFVELPKVGAEISKGDELCIVESVKSVSEIFAPISGKIIKINEVLDDSPEKINESPYDDGWLVEIELKDKSELDQLHSSETYKQSLN